LYATGVVDTDGKFASGGNMPAASLTPVAKNEKNLKQKISGHCPLNDYISYGHRIHDGIH
jgi:hypothetical protein